MEVVGSYHKGLIATVLASCASCCFVHSRHLDGVTYLGDLCLLIHLSFDTIINVIVIMTIIIIVIIIFIFIVIIISFF